MRCGLDTLTYRKVLYNISYIKTIHAQNLAEKEKYTFDFHRNAPAEVGEKVKRASTKGEHTLNAVYGS